MNAITAAQKATVRNNIVAACRRAADHLINRSDPRVAVTVTHAGVVSVVHTDFALDGIYDWYAARDTGTTSGTDVVIAWTFGQEGGHNYDDVIEEGDITEAVESIFESWLTTEDGPSPFEGTDPYAGRRMASPAAQALGALVIDASTEWADLADALKASYAAQTEGGAARPVGMFACSWTNYDGTLGTIGNAAIGDFDDHRVLIDLAGAKIQAEQSWNAIDIANAELAPFGVELDRHGCGSEVHDDPDVNVYVEHAMFLPWITFPVVTE
jgi:hypothetical protein